MPKRKDGNRNAKPKYQLLEEADMNQAANGLAKSILLLVEGDTEEIYFNALKSNKVLINILSHVTVEIAGNLGNAKKIAKEKQSEYDQIWIVVDNDKRNAFVLEENKSPFFATLSNEQLPESIRNRLRTAYNSDLHKYILSIYDYFQWLKTSIGIADTVEYWDKIQHFTPIKNRELEVYDKELIQKKNDKICLAYSCMCFEFWLILHFEQNRNAFLYVDKGKDKNIDVFTYFKTICPDYEKGKIKDSDQKKGKKGNNKKEKAREKCTAYTCLYSDWKKEYPTIEDEWDILFRIIKAYKNVKWLQNTMLPTLNRQSGKWYEVNPYILGMDDLIAELLNITALRQPIDYFGLTIEFDFDVQNCQLQIQIAAGERINIMDSPKECFEIKSNGQTSFLPEIQNNIESPNGYQIVNLRYNIPQEERVDLLLIFKDPRLDFKSKQLFILLD